MAWLVVGMAAATVAPFSRCAGQVPLSPAALAATKDGQTVFIACATGKRVLVFDTARRTVTASLPLPGSPSGLALSPDQTILFVTCAAPESTVCVVDLSRRKVRSTLQAGHTAVAPAIAPDGKTLFVCSRFENDVSVFDLPGGKLRRRVQVEREPIASDITPDGRFLIVANHLPEGRADASPAAAVVSVVEIATLQVVKSITLPDGSASMNGLRVSPDGKYALATHVLSRFRQPATQLDRGWMNSNAASILDLTRMELLNTVLLDEIDRGAANPWGVGWSADGSACVVTHAGTHEISIIAFPALVEKVAKASDTTGLSTRRADVPNDLAFLVGIRQRCKLPEGDRGPRAVVVAGQNAYIANYFSDSISIVDLQTRPPRTESIPLGPKTAMSLVRKGELCFNDATLCFQGWQSCATCHPGEGRVDGLNWDLLNDGIGNPKNTKSPLLSHRTPPAMSMGVRETAEMAVRAGLRHILFAEPTEDTASAIDAYLTSLKPVPSSALVHGRLTPAARRGAKLFKDPHVGCATCHPPGLFTDMQSYNVETGGAFDPPDALFDTPTLIETWRTAPYLHDGSAATIRDVLTTRNPRDAHGRTSHLTSQQIDDLVAYVLSL